VWSLVRSRVVWLLVLAVGATLTVQVLSVFEATIDQVTVLALFVPLLIGTGGNTGNQAATTVTRALALGDVRPRDIARVLTRELRAGAMLGLLLGSLGFAIAGFVYSPAIGAVIGLTLLAVCTVAAAGACRCWRARCESIPRCSRTPSSRPSSTRRASSSTS
jgi:magnesium transporter